MTPTVGRIVHYQSYGTPDGEHLSEPRAALVTQVHAVEGAVGLAVLKPSGLFFNEFVEHAEGDKPTAGRWNWPPRN
ncbi:hypothetical protein MURUCUTUMBU_4 [Mycobacterium phage Murucutumbu]|uniref:Uncharacterized protein n=1 Tax=Mycobacterium phage Murucutumbu TaxID=1560286 RepID=A0A0A0RRK0_9CAUD|nr:hypothetical protein AVV71_gp04 [Mycobacterium phage Murucutumbu]AIW02992.1 hypothetical protein MURUCUTUMBU_4 [Mycobacterium phage Murucutumbu]